MDDKMAMKETPEKYVRLNDILCVLSQFPDLPSIRLTRWDDKRQEAVTIATPIDEYILHYVTIFEGETFYVNTRLAMFDMIPTEKREDYLAYSRKIMNHQIVDEMATEYGEFDYNSSCLDGATIVRSSLTLLRKMKGENNDTGTDQERHSKSQDSSRLALH